MSISEKERELLRWLIESWQEQYSCWGDVTDEERARAAEVIELEKKL